MNYIRTEIVFPSELDEVFGIQTNKSRFTVNDYVEDKLKELGFTRAIFRQAKKHATFRETLFAVLNKNKIQESEKIATETSKSFIPVRLSDSVKNQEKLTYKKRIEKFRFEVESDETLDESEKEEEIENYEVKLEDLNYRIKEDILGTGEFFSVEFVGSSIEITVDTMHSFYNTVYMPAKENGTMGALQLMLFAFGKAQGDQAHNGTLKDMEELYRITRENWSMTLRKFLDNLSDINSPEQVTISSITDIEIEKPISDLYKEEIEADIENNEKMLREKKRLLNVLKYLLIAREKYRFGEKIFLLSIILKQCKRIMVKHL